MLTSYIRQTPKMNKEKRYKILFETYSYEQFKFVEDACKKTISNRMQAEWDKQHEHIILASGDIKEWDNYFCNNCNSMSSHPYDYCPYCGTKMSALTEASDDR